MCWPSSSRRWDGALSEGLVLSSAALPMRVSAHMCFPAQLCRGVQLGWVDGRCIALLNFVDLPSILPMLLSPLQVSLHRTMEKSAKEFAEWKKQRDRELLQLKKQGRLNAAQLQKLEALHSKQQAVLRRKTGAWRGQLLVCCCICGHAQTWACHERAGAPVGQAQRAHRLSASQPSRFILCSAEEAEAARRRLKELEDRKHRLASRPTTAQALPPSERPFTAPPAGVPAAAAAAGQPPRPPTAGAAGSAAVERSAPSASAATSSAEAECQPNPLAPLLRDEKGRRECELPVLGRVQPQLLGLHNRSCLAAGRLRTAHIVRLFPIPCVGLQGWRASWMPTALPTSCRWFGCAGVCWTAYDACSSSAFHAASNGTRPALPWCRAQCITLQLGLHDPNSNLCPACLVIAESDGGRAGAALGGAAQAEGGGEGTGPLAQPRVVGPRHRGAHQVGSTRGDGWTVCATRAALLAAVRRPGTVPGPPPTHPGLRLPCSLPALPCSPSGDCEEKLVRRKMALLAQSEEHSKAFEAAQAKLLEARQAEEARGGVPGAQSGGHAAAGCCRQCPAEPFMAVKRGSATADAALHWSMLAQPSLCPPCHPQPTPSAGTACGRWCRRVRCSRPSSAPPASTRRRQVTPAGRPDLLAHTQLGAPAPAFDC